MLNQRYTSQNTSINAINKVYTKGEYIRGSNILDYGGGKYDSNIEYMKQKGCHVIVYDPYNRSEEYNKNTMDFVSNNPIHYIVCSNVLNVIKEDDIITEIIKNILEIKQKNNGCKVYISVYEGDKTGNQKETTKGWQRNQKTSCYIEFINNLGYEAELNKGIIVID